MKSSVVRGCVCSAALVILAFLPATASASPWLVDDDELSLGMAYDFQYAENEFLPDGDAQSFPLNGRFSGNRFAINGRYGITSKFELYTSLTFKEITYTSDSVVLALPDDPSNQKAVNESIIDFNESAAGAGDFRLGARYQFANLDGVFVMASDTEIKFPTGYDKPSGTFENDTPAPSNIQDDVTLGDGQTDITQMFLMGAYVPPTATFTRLGMGYRVRFAEPGHQVVGEFKLGQFLGEHVIIYGELDGAYTVFEGEVIGKSFITRQPETDPDALASGEAGSIEPIDLRLDRSYIQAGGGAILRFRDFEFQAAYRQIILGNNIPAIKSVSASILYSFENLSGGPKDQGGE